MGDPLWLLEGPREAPGWVPLEGDARADAVDVRLFDRDGWALVRAPEAPTKYAGLVPATPRDGLYLDNLGRSVYVAGGDEVPGPLPVLATLGPRARELMEKYGDADVVLDRMGRVY